MSLSDVLQERRSPRGFSSSPALSLDKIGWLCWDRVIWAGAVLRDPLGRETIGNSTDDRQAVFNRGRRRHAIPDQSDRRLRRFETAVRKITDLDFPGAMANEPADVFSGAP